MFIVNVVEPNGCSDPLWYVDATNVVNARDMVVRELRSAGYEGKDISTFTVDLQCEIRVCDAVLLRITPIERITGKQIKKVFMELARL